MCVFFFHTETSNVQYTVLYVETEFLFDGMTAIYGRRKKCVFAFFLQGQ